MVGALHDNDVLLLGGVASELHRGFDSFGAGVPEEEGVQAWVWHDGHEAFDELEVGLLEGDVYLAVHEFAHLVLCGFGYCWVAVAEVGDADAAGKVEVFAAADHCYIAAGSALEDLWREAADAFGDMLGAELDKLLGGGAHDWRRWGEKRYSGAFLSSFKANGMDWREAMAGKSGGIGALM